MTSIVRCWRRSSVLALALVCTPSGAAIAQPVITHVFPPSEFAARRAAVMRAIGDGVAIFQGTIERPGEQPFRQSNQFYYLTGVAQPRVIAVIDGRTRKTALYLNRDPRDRAYGVLDCDLRLARDISRDARGTGAKRRASALRRPRASQPRLMLWESSSL